MGVKDLLREAHVSGTAAAPQKKVETPTIKETAAAVETVKEEPKKIPTQIAQVKRPDVDIEEYGIKPDITNFQLYNYELSEFLTSFSKRNKKNGGNAITKSQLMETILGFAFYDLKLKPKGYQSTQELLRDLQEKMKK